MYEPIYQPNLGNKTINLGEIRFGVLHYTMWIRCTAMHTWKFTFMSRVPRLFWSTDSCIRCGRETRWYPVPMIFTCACMKCRDLRNIIVFGSVRKRIR